MSRTIKTWLLLLTLSLTIFSCEKEYSEENGGLVGGGGTQSGTARFDFAGAPGGCTTPSITGTYKAGTALTSAEKITLIVNVTEVGTYTVATAKINGISFSGSGTFSATGQQFIELTANGSIPTNAGTFAYVPGTAGCSFSITYLASTGTSSGTAVYSFKGAPDDCLTPTISGTYTEGVALTSANTVKLLVNVTTPGTYTITTGTANGIKFSATGTFAAAGDADITLVGSGTPVSAATGIQYTPGGNGCAFSITVVPGSTSPGGAGTLTATIAGVATTFNVNLLAELENTASSGALKISGLKNSTDHEEIEVNFVAITGGITTGGYANLSASSISKFMLVIYTDAAGNQWQSSTSVPNTFTGNISTLNAATTIGTFSGTLYDNNGEGPGSKTLTLGTFNVTF